MRTDLLLERQEQYPEAQVARSALTYTHMFMSTVLERVLPYCCLDKEAWWWRETPGEDAPRW